MSHPSTPRANGAGSERGSWLSLEVYAEERDTWTPSYRAWVDGYMNAARVRVRLDDGSEQIATWDHEDKRWLTADGEGEPVEGVTHVWLGPVKRNGGPSGRNTTPRRLLACPPEAWELMDQAAERAIESWSEWARGKLAMAVADELHLEPEEMIELFDRER